MPEAWRSWTCPLEAELAARDDDRAAADLDLFDPVALACDAGVQGRRPLDLDALRNLDLVPEADPAVPDEMEREWACGRPRRRILGDAVDRGEHSRLPARAGSGEAVHPRFGHAREGGEVGLQPRDLLFRRHRDIHVRGPEVVDLDRQR